jgi:hypothetical protein
MIETLVSEQFEAVVTNAATGLVGTISFQVYDPTDASVIIAETTSGITEVSPGSYRKFATVDVLGTFHVRWEYTTNVAEEDLVVLSALPAEDEGEDTEGDLIMPTVDQVALLLRTRTVGPSSGLGGDTGSADATTFTNSTRPTSTEVESIIQTSYGAVEAMLRKPIPQTEILSVQHAVALYAAILIETSFFRENSNAEALAALRGMLNDTVAGINEMVSLAEGRGFGTLRVSTPLASSRRGLSNDVIEGLDT